MKLTKYLYYLFVLLLTSCATTKYTNLADTKRINITNENYSILNGTYLNYPDTTIGVAKDNEGKIEMLSLWKHISRFDKANKTWIKDKVVKIKILSKEKIQFQLCKADSVIDTKEVAGHIKDGYFYSSPYFILSPFVPIFFGYTDDKYRIGLVENKLIVDNNSRYWWFFLVAGGSRRIKASCSYSKL